MGSDKKQQRSSNCCTKNLHQHYNMNNLPANTSQNQTNTYNNSGHYDSYYYQDQNGYGYQNENLQNSNNKSLQNNSLIDQSSNQNTQDYYYTSQYGQNFYQNQTNLEN